MKTKIALLLCFFILCSHDMYLKMDSFFLSPHQESTINLYNGTFDKSENIIDRDRMIDVSLTGNGKRITMKEDQWTEKDSITTLHFTTGDPGTWVAGVSTKPRSIEMDGAAFNKYLKHDGITDMLALRREQGILDDSAVEKYSKHVKAIFQVGDTKTDDWSTILGYPIEFVPQSNPYEAHTGDVLKVQLLRDGKPLANELVYADYKPAPNSHSHDTKEAHSHDGGEAHTHEEENTHSHDGEEAHSHEKENTHGHDGEEAHSHEKENTHSHDGGEAHSHEKENTHSHDGEEAHSHENENTHSHDGEEAHSHEKENTHSHDGEEAHSHEKENTHSHDGEPPHSHDENSENDHQHTTGQQLRSDANGMVDVQLTGDGFWYIRTIHLVPSNEEGFTHESNWATLTFEITHSHDHNHDDEHSHEDEGGIPSYVFWIGSLILLGGLFFFFSKKK